MIAEGLVIKLAGGVVQLATALYPASVLTKPNQSFRVLYHQLQLGLLLLAVVGIGLYRALGLAFLSWWLGSPELVSLVDSVLKILVWYFAILILTPLPSTVLEARGRPGLSSLFVFITAGLEIALALLLFPRFGLFAPVYAALASAALTTPALLYQTERVLQPKA